MVTKVLHIVMMVMSATLATVAAASVKERCHPADKKALLAINQVMSSYGTPFPSWTPDTDCCRSWYGVKCGPGNVTRRVKYLYITGSDSFSSSGVIPEAVGDLPALATLRVHKNYNITGTIPSSVSKLQNLLYADFSWNSLAGTIPDFFHHMKNLLGINLSFNRFSGSIPPSLALGPAIISIDLSRNLLSGSIPETFGSFRNPVYGLWLSKNMLSGAVPTSLGNVQFETIDFSRNELTGDIAFLYANKSNFEHVDLSRNRFLFNMSSIELDSTSNITYLDLSHNDIFGSLPSALADLQHLWFLNVSYNRLCGQIPTGGKLSGFDQTSYVHNKCLCGSPLPACH